MNLILCSFQTSNFIDIVREHSGLFQEPVQMSGSYRNVALYCARLKRVCMKVNQKTLNFEEITSSKY